MRFIVPNPLKFLAAFLLPALVIGHLSVANAQGPATSALISEYQPNPNGGDPATQNIEISGPASTSSTLWVLLIESDTSSTSGTVDLAEMFTVNFNAEGLGVISIPDLENPSNVLVLVDDFTGTAGLDLDTDDDGTIDVELPWTTTLDSISVPDEFDDEIYGAALVASLGVGNAFVYTGDEPQLVFRDGTSGAWFAINDPDNGAAFDLSATNVLEDGSMVFNANQVLPTFGSTNPSLVENTEPPPLTVSLEPRQISEEESFPIFGSVTRPAGLTSGEVEVSLSISSGDAGRVTLSNTTVTLLDGADFESFEIQPNSNTVLDGDVVLTLQASATGYVSGEVTFAVIDDETPAPTLVINEVLSDAGGSGGPDFIELYNGGTSPVDISGYKVVSYSADPDFGLGTLDESIVIPAATTIQPGGFYLIGASDPSEADSVGQVYGVTPDLIVPDFNLDDFDVSISLLDASDSPVFTALIEDAEFDSIANVAGVQVPADIAPGPDGTFGPAGYYLATDGGTEAGFIEFVGNTAVAPSATPGATNFLPAQLFVQADVSEIAEGSGDNSVTFTVSRFPSTNTSGDLVIDLSSSDSGELTVPATVTIFDGDVEATFSGSPQVDSVADGDQLVTIGVSATDYISATTEVLVTDDQATFPTLVINEVLSDGSGSGSPDFVEIYNGSGAAIDLTGYKIIVDEADPDNSLGTRINEITITTGTILDGGFFLIGGEDFQSVYGITPDQLETGLDIGDDDISISLLDGSGNRIFTALLEDADGDASANIAGTIVSADVNPGQDGTFGPAGYYLLPDGGAIASQIEYVNKSTVAPSATPGTTNVRLTLTADVSSVAEDGEAVNFAVSRGMLTDGELVVSLSSDDTTELTVPDTVTIQDGSTFAIFQGTPLTDDTPDGDVVVTVTASATGIAAADLAVTVSDINVAPVATMALLNEYQPNPVGADPTDTVFELSGPPSTAASLWILSVDLDAGSVGVVDLARKATVAFDANGLGLVTIAGFNLENPSHAIVIVDNFTGSQGVDLDMDEDGSIDVVAPWDNLLDALSVPDEVPDATIGASFITSIGGGSAFTYTGDEPQLVFRDGTTGAWYAINDPDLGEAFDISATNVLANASFDSNPTQSTFGAVNPSLMAGSNTFANWIAGFGGATDTTPEGSNDNDGPNVLDAFFGTDPTVDDDNAFRNIEAAGGVLAFQHKLAKVEIANLSGAYEWSVDLDGWNADGAEVNGITVVFGDPVVVDSSDPDSDIVEVVATITGASATELFVRLNVTSP